MGYNLQLGIPTFIAMNNTATGTIAANTRRDIFSIDHAIGATKFVRITRIAASWLATTALASDLRVYMYRGILQATAGTVMTPQPKHSEFSAPEAVVRLNPTITAATLMWSHIFGTVPATANSVLIRQILYDAPTNGRDDDFMLRRTTLEGFAIAVTNTGNNVNWTPFLEVTFTED